MVLLHRVEEYKNKKILCHLLKEIICTTVQFEYFFYILGTSFFCSQSPRLYLFDQKYSKNYEILLKFKTAVFYVNMC